MKNKLRIMGIIILLIITSTITSFADTESTIVLQVLEDKTEVKAGESFTVVLNASCANGIGGVAGLSYNYDSEKLEVTQESIGQNFVSFEENGITLMYSGNTIVNEAEIYTITFTVKDGVEAGGTTITLNEAILVDATTDANQYTIPAQDLTINVVGDTTGGGTGEGEENPPVEDGEGEENPPVEDGEGEENPPVDDGEGEQNPPATEDKNEQQQPTTDGTTIIVGDDKKDDTVADKEIPKAGINSIIVIAIVTIGLLAVVMYRKSQKYQDIR